MKNNTIPTLNSTMSTFTKIVLGLNAINILFCVYLFGMITAGAPFSFWYIFILMMVSILTIIADTTNTKK